MRLHGNRLPHDPDFCTEATGGPNEVRSFGEAAYDIRRDHLLLRERLCPYLTRLSEEAHRTGVLPMRPLFFDFPDDEHAWGVHDQFLLGPTALVVPVYEAARGPARCNRRPARAGATRSPDAWSRAVRRSTSRPRWSAFPSLSARGPTSSARTPHPSRPPRRPVSCPCTKDSRAMHSPRPRQESDF
ncbi:hypothetical protein [Streptomyces sp. NPDC050121]|uniref:hypothetical protein n=1 Tax=Streptomyces sp. NPDC050121 TaxID=3365601 RepID=UPI00379618F4